MYSLLRFIARRLLNGPVAKSPFVRRFLFLVAVLRWLNKRFGGSPQQIKLRRGETLVVSVTKDKEARL